jgi:hypothetical protein
MRRVGGSALRTEDDRGLRARDTSLFGDRSWTFRIRTNRLLRELLESEE